MSTETQVNLITENLQEDDEIRTRDMSDISIPDDVEVFEVYGSLFFGAISQFKDSIRRVAKKPKVLILRMRHVPAIDASGLHILEELAKDAKENGYILVFSAVNRNLYRAMRKSGLVEMIGREHFAADIFAALEITEKHLSGSQK